MNQILCKILLSIVICTVHDLAAMERLWDAIQKKQDAELAKNLIDQSPQLLAATNERKITPVHLAAAYLTRDFFEQLSQTHTLKYDTPDDQGNLPLHICARSRASSEDTLLFLLEKSDPIAKNVHGQTALHVATLAALPNNVQLICGFLQFNTQTMHIPNNDGQTPLHCCALGPRMDYTLIFSTLCKKGPEEPPTNLLMYKDSQGRTVAHLAAIQHRRGLLNLALKANKALLEEKDIEGKTPLASFLASKQEEFDNDIFTILISSGAYILALDNDENTMLHHAASQRRFEEFKKLTALHLNPNKKNKLRQTPLIFYLVSNPEISAKDINTLFGLGAQTTILDDQGNTLYHMAILYHHVPLVEYCANQNLDINAKNSSGKTPIALLLSSDPQSHDNQLYTALMKKNLDITEIDNDGNTMLHHAARTGRKEIIKELLDKGLQKTTRNKNDKTPLDLCNNPETQHLLGEDNDWELLNPASSIQK